MPTDVRVQLRDLGDQLSRDSAPITLDEIVGSGELAPSSAMTPIRNIRQRKTRTTMVRAAALVATAAAVVGLVMIADRPAADPFANRPDTTVLPEPVAPAGALVLDADLPGWELRTASVGRPATNAELFIRRIYTTNDPRPENGPSLVVESFDVDASTPELETSNASISIRGVDGYLFDRSAGGRGLVFENNGYWYDLTAYNLTDTQLAAAAGAARRADDGDGAVIDPTALPDELVSEAAGVEGESWFLSLSALANPMSSARWENGTSSMWLQNFDQDPSIDRFQRVGAGSVVDTTVNGQPAFIRTLQGQVEFRSITWHEDGHTHSLGSLGVSEQDLIAFAETLRPATSMEWDDAVVSVTPPMACLGADCTDPPAPGSIIPAGVDSFPAIDDSLVSDDGSATTYAQYSYFGGGESRGTTWIGVLGAPDAEVLDGLVTVMVSAASDAEPLPVGPGRSPDIGEYDYGTGVELVKTHPNGSVVIVQGRDIDQLYQVLENIDPTTTDGDLSGYQLTGDLPEGLEELAAPFERGIDNGSFPKLYVHGGALHITVMPGPLLPAVSGFIGPIEQLTINDRPALFHSPPQNSYAFLALTLANGNTMTLEGEGFSQQELIDLASNVEFLDERTWNDRYNPILPILPRTVDAPATTESVEQGD